MLGRDWSRYLDIAHPHIRTRFAAVRSFLKYAVGTLLDAETSELELSYGPTGRPYLRGFEGLDISLGHTSDLLLLGLTECGLIGVDVQRTDQELYNKGMAQYVCTPYETVSLAGLPEQRPMPH